MFPALFEGQTKAVIELASLRAFPPTHLAFLEQRTGVEVGCISTGPERNQTIVRAGSRFQQLVG